MLSFSAMTFISRMLGLVREQAIAYAFGANAATDAFWVAFRIPNFLRRLFAEGSFSVAFVPVFTEVKETRSPRGTEGNSSRARPARSAACCSSSRRSACSAPTGSRAAFAPGAIDEPEKFALTTDLLRITFPFLLFVSLTALAGGVLNSFHKFRAAGADAGHAQPVHDRRRAVARAASRHADHGARLGDPRRPASCNCCAVAGAGEARPAALPRWGWNHPDVRRIMRLMVPTLFGSSVAQINLLLDTLIASFLIAGSQTWLAQTDRLLEFPLGIFGVALGTVILPSLSRHHVATDREGFSRSARLGTAHRAADFGAGDARPGAARQADRRDVAPARPFHRARCRHGGAVAVGAELRACRRSRWSRSSRRRSTRGRTRKHAGARGRRRDDREHGHERSVRRRVPPDSSKPCSHFNIRHCPAH